MQALLLLEVQVLVAPAVYQELVQMLPLLIEALAEVVAVERGLL